jgi:chromosome segregation ATPase
VKEAIASFNVQVDNLCQFLPQDKVSSFSSLDGSALLRATERALERPDSKVYEMHDQLHEMKTRLRAASRSTMALREKISVLEALQATAERDVLRFKERERLVDEVAWLKKKLPWMKFETLRARTMELMNALKEHEKQLDALRARLQPYDERIARASTEATAAAAHSRPLREKVSKMLQAVTRQQQALDQIVADYVALKDKRERLASEIESRAKRIKLAEQAATVARDKLAELESSTPAIAQRVQAAAAEAEGAEAEIEKAQQESVRTSSGKRQVDDRLRDAERQLHELSDRERQKLHKLRQQKHVETTLDAYYFLRNPGSQGVFRQPVVGPVCLMIEPKDEAIAAMVEVALPSSVLKSFVVFCEEDRSELRKRFNVNVQYAPNAVTRARRVNDDEKRRLRIDYWMDEVIDCEDSVMNMLLGSVSLSSIALCRPDADHLALAEAGISYFFLRGQQYTVTRSRFGRNELVFKVRDVSLAKAHVLQRGGNAEQERELRAEIDMIRTQRETIDAEMQRARDREQAAKALLSAARSAQSALVHHQTTTERAQRAVRGADERLAEAQEAARGNIDEQRAALTQKINESNQRRLKALQALAEQVEAVVAATRESDSAELLREVMTERLAASRAECTALRSEVSEIEDQVIVSRNEYDAKKVETRAQKARAETECPIDAAAREKFAQLPDTEELVQSQIDDKEGRISLIVLSTSVMREYTEREAQLATLRPQLASADDTHEKEVLQLESLHAKWLPLMQQITAKLNNSFATFMRELGCAGEVALQEDKDDYDKWQLQIRVTFRNNEALQPLSAHVHSGGERSVSTMLFLIAMQDLSDCPFRLVDEINQGMDPRNERAIFSLVVRAATRPNTPQYFLITPKLLLDLEYSEAATVLAVFNGPQMIKQEDFTPDSFIRAAAKKRRTAAVSEGVENSRPQQ